MNLLESKTYYNLAKSFAGECQAQTRYKFIEYGARKEGLKAVAKAIDELVYNEFNHARMFYTYLQKATDKTIEKIDICADYPFKEKWNLEENLKFAHEDEKKEADVIYAEFEKTAREEGFLEIAELYKNVRQVENCHSMLLKQLYEQVKSGKMYKSNQKEKWKCSACGYEAEGKEAWDVCPLCGEVQGAVNLKIEDGSC